MKRGKKSPGETVIVTRDYVKSTYLLDPVLKANLRYLGLSRQKEPSDLVREALAGYVRQQGLDPQKMPKFVFPDS